MTYFAAPAVSTLASGGVDWNAVSAIALIYLLKGGCAEFRAQLQALGRLRAGSTPRTGSGLSPFLPSSRTA